MEDYFERLLKRVEESDIANDGKDRNGFYMPTRTLLVRHLTLLRDLHAKPAAQGLVKNAWQFVVENLPPDWLILTSAQKAVLKKILGS